MEILLAILLIIFVLFIVSLAFAIDDHFKRQARRKARREEIARNPLPPDFWLGAQATIVKGQSGVIYNYLPTARESQQSVNFEFEVDHKLVGLRLFRVINRWNDLEPRALIMVDRMPFGRRLSDPNEINDADVRAGVVTACADIRALVVLYHTGP
jgi:hypothetical protein